MGSWRIAPFLFAVFIGASPAAASAAVSNTAATPPSPVVLSTSPVLTQKSAHAWSTAVFLNTASLCPTPSFRLITTTPDHVWSAQPTFSPSLLCGKNAPAISGPATRCVPATSSKSVTTAKPTSTSTPKAPSKPTTTPAPTGTATPGPATTRRPVTSVLLTFCLSGTAAPGAATLVITPQHPVAAPIEVALIVQRLVTAGQYALYPISCGLGLAFLLVALTTIFGLPGPNRPARAGLARFSARPLYFMAHLPWAQFWSRSLYASAAWTFGDSWATNITAVGTVTSTVLAASGAVSGLLPGVDLGRFSLLITVAGGITVAAPLVFGALNYRFARVDPTTAGVAVITLPPVRAATPDDDSRAVVIRSLRHRFRYESIVVNVPASTRVDTLGGSFELSSHPAEFSGRGVTLPKGTRITHDGGETVTLQRKTTAFLPRESATIAVPAGAVITVPDSPVIQLRDLASSDASQPAGESSGTLRAGAALTVPAGASITVSRPSTESGTGGAAMRILALPGGNDIAVFAGQQLKISVPVSIAASDVLVAPVPPRGLAKRHLAKAPPAQPAGGGTLPPDSSIALAEGAKITFLGRASIVLPAGTCMDAPAATPPDQQARQPADSQARQSAGSPHLATRPAKRSCLRSETVFAVPHTAQVIATRMWSLLAAACVTMFGIGAELGILGVLVELSTADPTTRLICLVMTATAAVTVLSYGVVSIRALADVTPGSALSATDGTSFTL